MLNNLLRRIYDNASEMNRRNIIELAARAGGDVLLDLGCDDGSFTRRLGEAVGALELHGVEVVDVQARRAEQNGIKVTSADLNRPLTALPSNAFDIVHANQV